ncbi:MAG: F0F1 ATP synthase subunit A [Actinomycetota bacterium]|nr:F0F1 ATP synthase subunit A [Actinomycetota bacterium]
MSTARKVGIFFAGYAVLLIAMFLIFGSDGKNDEFQPQNEFLLDPWISIEIFGLDMSINKAVLYIVLAAVFTCVAMIYIANRMKAKPNRVQMATELAYDVVAKQITRDNLNDKMAARWFPFLGTLFFFILFSNFIGLIPLPTNTEHEIDIFGVMVPSFALYAATANISIPLALSLVVWIAFNVEGVRDKGFFGYLKSWLPAGIEDMPGAFKGFVFVIEAISKTVRLISLSVRLFANILAGHLLLLFMGGGLAVLLGLSALGALTFPMAFAFFVFEIIIVAGLQAFIFSILTAIYLGEATSESH